MENLSSRIMDSIKSGADMAAKTVNNSIGDVVDSSLNFINKGDHSGITNMNGNVGNVGNHSLLNNENLISNISGGNSKSINNKELDVGFAIKQAGAAAQYAKKAMDLAKEADSALKRIQSGGMKGGKSKRVSRRGKRVSRRGKRVSRRSRRVSRRGKRVSRRSRRVSKRKNVKKSSKNAGHHEFIALSATAINNFFKPKNNKNKNK